MKEKLEKIKENKLLKFIGNFIYYILFIIVALVLLLTILQRTSNNTMSIGGYRIFVVATESMVPKYKVGDVLVAKEINAKELKVGDDIVYKGEVSDFQGKMITHRIISIEQGKNEYKIITKGIANELEDPPITENQVYGKILYKIKTLSLIEKIVNNTYAFFFIIFVPIAITIVKAIINIMANSDDEDEDDDKTDDEESHEDDKK